MTSIVRKFLRFAGVGVFGTIAHYAVLVAIVEMLRLDVIIGSSMGFIVGAAVNYILNYHYTFESTKEHKETLPKFYFIAALGFIINGTIVYILAHIGSINYIYAQIVATMLVLIWGFTANYFWTFIEKPSS